MAALRISLLGGVHVAHETVLSNGKLSKTGQSLIAYLVLHRQRTHSRDALAGMFWGEQPQTRARSNLSTALWRLRLFLEPKEAGIAHGTYLAITAEGQITFNNSSEYWLDVAAFENGVRAALAKSAEDMSRTDSHRLQCALQLYRGDLLEGFYADWALHERGRLHALHVEGLKHLMDCLSREATQDAYAQSVAVGQLLLYHEPLREDIHQRLITLHLEQGQRALAVRQYESCREVLATELGVAPLRETRALLADAFPAIGSAGDDYLPASAPTPVEPPSPPSLPQALERARLAIQSLEEARSLLQQAIYMAENLTD